MSCRINVSPRVPGTGTGITGTGTAGTGSGAALGISAAGNGSTGMIGSSSLLEFDSATKCEELIKIHFFWGGG